MTTVIKAQNSQEDISNLIIPVVAQGLVGWGYPFDTNIKAGKNYAKVNGKFTIIGSPDVTQHGISLDGVNQKYISTDIQESNEMTYLIVLKSNDALDADNTKPYFMTTLGGKSLADQTRTTSGVSLFAASDATISLSSYRYNYTTLANSSQAITVGVDLSEYSFIAASIGNLSRYLWNLTTNNKTGGTTSWARDVSNGELRIGKRDPVVNTFDGKSQVAFYAVYNRMLSDSEIQSVYTQVQLYLKEVRGITV